MQDMRMPDPRKLSAQTRKSQYGYSPGDQDMRLEMLNSLSLPQRYTAATSAGRNSVALIPPRTAGIGNVDVAPEGASPKPKFTPYNPLGLPENHQGIQTTPNGWYGVSGWHELPGEGRVWGAASVNSVAPVPPKPAQGPPPVGYADFIARLNARQNDLMQYLSGLPKVASPARQENYGFSPNGIRPGPNGQAEGLNDDGQWEPLKLRMAPPEFSVENEGQKIDEWEKLHPAIDMPQEFVNYYSSETRRSDRRLKSEIKRIGTHPIGVGLYEYNIDGRRERGVMAQELLLVKPEAVVMGDDGFYRVNYGML